MREITASGETLEEAIQSALTQLNITEDKAEIEVIDEGKKGFLGLFGSVRAVVKVREKLDTISETKNFIQEVAKNMGVDVTIETEQVDQRVVFHLSGEKIALLIGKRGKTLNALQYLAQLVLNKHTEQFHSVIIDAEGYRKRREETLVDLAEKMANRAIRINKTVTLEPMPAYERKIIHSALQNISEVTTFSDGVEPYRHIVIKPVKLNEDQ